MEKREKFLGKNVLVNARLKFSHFWEFIVLNRGLKISINIGDENWEIVVEETYFFVEICNKKVLGGFLSVAIMVGFYLSTNIHIYQQHFIWFHQNFLKFCNLFILLQNKTIYNAGAKN